MSQAEIMGSVTSTVRFLKDRLKSEIVEKSNDEDLRLDSNQLKKLLFIVESSIDESYNRSMNEIITAVESSVSRKKK